MRFLSRALLAGLTIVLGVSSGRADDWPQWLGPQRDSVWRETGILDKFPEGGPKVLWRVAIAGGYAGPAVADGKVYVADYRTNADTRKASSPQARPKLQGKERVLCLDAKSGREIWKYEYECPYAISYPAGPRCTPTVHEGKVYTLGAEGNLCCLDAAKGTLLWSKDFKKDYHAKTAIWGYAGHPLVDGQKLFCVVGGPDSLAVAFDKDTGKEIWRSLSARETGYAPPTLIEAGGVRQLLIWHGEALNSLDPETGKPYWSVPLQSYMGMAIMTPRKLGDYLFVGGAFGKAVLLKLDAGKPAVTEVWRGKNDTAVYPVNSTPFLEDGLMYGVDQPGQLRAVKLATGERLWETFQPLSEKKNVRQVGSGTVFLVKNGDRFLLASETGHLLIAKLGPKGYEEVSRWKMLEPTGAAFGRDVWWSHPAFANKCVFARNDQELVCVSLAAE
jgi:outer membrane protein assembly factor BamB